MRRACSTFISIFPDHGGVDVRIRMTDGALAIRVVADREDTARRIRNSRDELTDALRQGGHDATVTSVESRRVEDVRRRAPATVRSPVERTAAAWAPGLAHKAGGEPADAAAAPAPFVDDRSVDSRTEPSQCRVACYPAADRLYV